MTVHLIKLAVGIDDVDHLISRQKKLLLASGNPRCRTRMMPKRLDELLDGGSLYWVIKRFIQVRQKIIDVHQKRDSEGRSYCLIELEKKPVLVQPVHRRAFQGWRYLKAEDAPDDVRRGGKIYIDPKMPRDMQDELRKLGLL